MKNLPSKVLLLDIETSPILAYVWQLFDQNIPLNMVKEDWSILAWSAKWLDQPASKIMYADQRNAKNINDDKQLLQGIWKLLDEARVVITQNGVSFDLKKLNARFILNGMKPPSSFRNIDTKQLASRKFGFTSNKLEYMTNNLCKKYKKLKHKKFPGFELWTECLKGNKAAWKEMEAYNKYDVLSLEELYKKLAPWDSSIDFAKMTDQPENPVCSCGSKKFTKYGFRFTNTGKFQRLRCEECGADYKTTKNLLKK